MPPLSLSKHLFLVGCGAEGKTPRDLPASEVVGSKAANLMRMAEAGLPVPPGFVLDTGLCRAYFRRGKKLPEGFGDLLAAAVRQVEAATGMVFGGDRRPMLLAVRSGAAVSMPGMMDTVLNVGLCDHTLPALVRMTGNPRHAWDCYRRLVQGYAEAVHDLSGDPFARMLDASLKREGVPVVGELDFNALRGLTRDYLEHFESQTGRPFPQDPSIQFLGAVEAVIRSWERARAVEYRRLHKLGGPGGTAVTVQTMVFGNLGATSGSGVAFTRDPATGEKSLFADFLWNAQGEDVVSGRARMDDIGNFQRTAPGLYRDLGRVGEQLESIFRDAQDIEFTVQEGRLYLLQTRRAKRTAWAALRIACDLVNEGVIDEGEALKRLSELNLAAVQRLRLGPAESCAQEPPLTVGVPASPGVAVGEVALSPESATAMAAQGRTPILVRGDLTPDDIAGLAAAAGVLTARGSRTSHAAVVARQLDKVCVVGCPDLVIAEDCHSCRIAGHAFAAGAPISLDGNTGRVFAGKLDVVVERPTDYLAQVERWKGAGSKPARRIKT